MDGPDADEPTTASHVAMEEELDPETFDDTDFYQQLLKEFLDSSGTSSEGSARFVFMLVLFVCSHSSL